VVKPSNDCANLVVVYACRRIRSLLVGVTKHFGHDPTFGFLFTDAKLLRDDLHVLLRERVFVGVQLPIKSNREPREK